MSTLEVYDTVILNARWDRLIHDSLEDMTLYYLSSISGMQKLGLESEMWGIPL